MPSDTNYTKLYGGIQMKKKNVKIHENLNLDGSSKITTDLLAHRSTEVSPTHQY